jgi:hypothetical protein
MMYLFVENFADIGETPRYLIVFGDKSDFHAYAWDEKGFPEISGNFSSKTAAILTLEENRSYLEACGFRLFG